MIILASILRRTDYRTTGNTLKLLRLDNATVEQVGRAFRGGDMWEASVQAKKAKFEHGKLQHLTVLRWWDFASYGLFFSLKM